MPFEVQLEERTFEAEEAHDLVLEQNMQLITGFVGAEVAKATDQLVDEVTSKLGAIREVVNRESTTETEYVNGRREESDILRNAFQPDMPVFRGALYENYLDTILPTGSKEREKAEEAITAAPATEGKVFGYVAIPVSADEQSETLFKTLDELSRQESINEYEVVVWGNHPDSNELAGKKWDKLFADCYDKFPDMRLRLVQRGYDDEVLNNGSIMLNVRSDYMHMILLDAKQRELPVETPVMWLDADIEKLSKGTITKLMYAAVESEAPVVTPNLRFSHPNLKAQGITDMSHPESVVGAEEVIRRITRRRGAVKDFRIDGYVEECGMTIKLGDYAVCGGLPTGAPVNGFGETALLRRGIKITTDKTVKLPYGDIEMRVLESQFLYARGNQTSFSDTVDDARIYFSARRQLARVRRMMSGDLNGVVGYGVRDQAQYGKMQEFHEQEYRTLENDKTIKGNAKAGQLILKRSMGDDTHELDEALREKLFNRLTREKDAEGS